MAAISSCAMNVEPMLCLLVPELPDGDEWAYEIKWDGYRCIASKEGRKCDLRSRNAKSLSAIAPDVQTELCDLKAKTCTFDGELVAFVDGKPSFQALQNHRTSRSDVRFVAFDLLEIDGKDLRHTKWRARRRLLERLIPKRSQNLILSRELPHDPEQLMHQAQTLGLEGIVAKRVDSEYEEDERSGAWSKWKATPDRPHKEAVDLKLSVTGSKTHRAPYHLINAALNVPGSRNSTMQGRLTDFFLFSPAWCGSPLTGYQPTIAWEEADPHLDLGTAMAISGGAAAPQMGLSTRRNLSFWLVLLNIRLGYWLRKPGASKGSPGLGCLLNEMLGNMDENARWLNVSDGGHIENLGVYELLRRRCKFIIAIDGEQDGSMMFASLTTLQRLASIDLGISIEIILDDLRLNSQGFSRSHFRFCRIKYPPLSGRTLDAEKGATGYLLYIKLSLTGNEGEFIRRYRLDEPVFPHHSTTDQFFTEAQFEAYRSLGEHVGDKLFISTLVGRAIATSTNVQVESWFEALAENLLEPLQD